MALQKALYSTLMQYELQNSIIHGLGYHTQVVSVRLLMLFLDILLALVSLQSTLLAFHDWYFGCSSHTLAAHGTSVLLVSAACTVLLACIGLGVAGIAAAGIRGVWVLCALAE